MAALKDREIEARGAGKVVSRADELALLTKMVKTRQESAAIYAEAGRAELAAQEDAEVAVIGEFLPRQMDEAAVIEAARTAIASTGAASVKDMGRVINALKEGYPGQMDFAKASGIVKGAVSQAPAATMLNRQRSTGAVANSAASATARPEKSQSGRCGNRARTRCR